MPPPFLHRTTAATPGRLPHLRQQTATFVDVKLKWVRDRGLDHAVEKEKHLRPFHALKDLLLLNATTSSSLPLSSISAKRDDLFLPFRPIRFIRKYPTAFVEHSPSPPPLPSSASSPLPSTVYQPTISPTPELARLHEEEISVYHSCKEESADRLLRLLMLTCHKKIPLCVVDRLRWDLGLPPDYVQSLLPCFPDYFQVISQSNELELVCWNNDLAVSAMERKVRSGYRKGEPLPFNVSYPRGFQMDKKVKKWMDEWQKLPYVSPYDKEGVKLDKSNPIAEKWTVGVMHELLHLLVGKKSAKEDLLLLGEHVGLRSGFNKAMVNYPGIFYVSYKNMIQTVMVRDAFKRDVTVERHPLMIVRLKYTHLMHEEAKNDAAAARREKGNVVLRRDGEDGVCEEDSDDDDDDDDDDDEYSDEEDEEDSETGALDAAVGKKVSASKGTSKKGNGPVGSGLSSTENSHQREKVPRCCRLKKQRSSDVAVPTMKSKGHTFELRSVEKRLQTRKPIHGRR